MRHRIIQIAAASLPRDREQPDVVTLFALCEDGSLWRRDLISGHLATWNEIPSPTVEQRRAVEAAR